MKSDDMSKRVDTIIKFDKLIETKELLLERFNEPKKWFPEVPSQAAELIKKQLEKELSYLRENRD